MMLNTAHVCRPMPGYERSGDAVVVRQSEARTLFAVIDALGHGPAAAQVADRATAVLETEDLSHEPADIVQELHRALAGSRGCAALVCIVEGDQLTGCGVGNVEVRSVRAALSAFLNAGIVGIRVRKFRPFSGQLRRGSRLVLFSDGLSSQLSVREAEGLDPPAACRKFMERYAKPSDDASVLVVDAL
jgi:negative regulator of sigma-B (phosphoserine phosphatase)